MADESSISVVQGRSSDQIAKSVEATIDSALCDGAAESNRNSSNGSESSDVSIDGESEKYLEYADELMASGCIAVKEHDYAEACDCYSRALEIRTEHFGELAPKCVDAYYKYGRALLSKAQEEADPLGSMPKKEDVLQEGSEKDTSGKTSVDGGSSVATVSNGVEQIGKAECSEDIPHDNEQGVEEEGEDESAEELFDDSDEDESDLDLAWKMLDVARAIVEKQSGDTMQKVDILSALAEVSLEREDIETSLSDYLKALSILDHLVEPDSRLIAELNFRICLCLEIGSKPEAAIPYCKNALSICKSRMERLKVEVKSFSKPPESATASETGQAVPQSSITTPVADDSLEQKEAESETLNSLCGELEKKLEDLQQLVVSSKSTLSDILERMSAKAKANEKNSISPPPGNTESASAIVSQAQLNGATGVTHLGVVGRGVKRAVMSSTMPSSPAKIPAIDPSS